MHKSCIGDWQEPYGSEGVELRILQQLPMEADGQILGFDIASYAHHNFDHTWFSHGHHVGVFEELGIRPDRFGLLQTREEAIFARDYAHAHDGYTYEYWLRVEYLFNIFLAKYDEPNGGLSVESIRCSDGEAHERLHHFNS